MPLVLKNLSIRMMAFDDSILDIESSDFTLTFCRDSVAIAFSALSALTYLGWAGVSWQWKAPLFLTATKHNRLLLLSSIFLG